MFTDVHAYNSMDPTISLNEIYFQLDMFQDRSDRIIYWFKTDKINQSDNCESIYYFLSSPEMKIQP